MDNVNVKFRSLLFIIVPFNPKKCTGDGLEKVSNSTNGKGRHKKNRLLLGKSHKLWVGGGQES